MSRWQRLDLYPAPMPAQPAVYAVFIFGRVRYVGSTGNLRTRFAQHGIQVDDHGNAITPWGRFDSPTNAVEVRVSLGGSFGSWLMREARLIRRLRPQYNVRGIALGI